MVSGILTPIVTSLPMLIVDLKIPQPVFYKFVVDAIWSKESTIDVLKRWEIN